jgi:hypothetical protein
MTGRGILRLVRIVRIAALVVVAVLGACEEEDVPEVPCACDETTGGLLITLAPTCPAPGGLPLVRIDAKLLEPDALRCIDDGVWAYRWPDWALNGTIATVVNDGTETTFVVDRVACVAVTMDCTIESRP